MKNKALKFLFKALWYLFICVIGFLFSSLTGLIVEPLHKLEAISVISMVLGAGLYVLWNVVNKAIDKVDFESEQN